VQAYADDICILIPYNRNQILALQQEIDKAINAAIEWGDAHKVSFNDKTSIILLKQLSAR